jgi:hypothetical protein
MALSRFGGSNLPPGCTDADIERAQRGSAMEDGCLECGGDIEEYGERCACLHWRCLSETCGGCGTVETCRSCASDERSESRE